MNAIKTNRKQLKALKTKAAELETALTFAREREEACYKTGAGLARTLSWTNKAIEIGEAYYTVLDRIAELEG